MDPQPSTLTQPKPGRVLFLERFSHLSFTAQRNILQAYIFAKYGHRGQMRADGSRYFEHCRAVALIIADELQLRGNWRMICAALLHDLIEDQWLLDKDWMARMFGTRVADWVDLVTKKPDQDAPEYFLAIAESRHWQAQLIKLCDRLHNLRTLGARPVDKQREQIAETRRFILPLAKVLGSHIPEKLRNTVDYLNQQLRALCERYEAQFARLEP